MNGNDIATPAFRPAPRDLLTALALLTRLPLPFLSFSANDPRPAAHAAWAYPLVGVIVSVIAAIAGFCAIAIGLPVPVAALFVVLASIFTTGAMHEDGLADCADGFWGGWTRERRLEIMKDSQIGTYGMIALLLGLGLRGLAISALLASGLLLPAILASAVISRAAMVGVMYALPPARTSGLSRQTGTPPLGSVAIAGAIGLIAMLFIVPAPLLMLVLAVAIVMGGCVTIAKRKIGGQTGDVLGGTQQIIEITVLLACLAALP